MKLSGVSKTNTAYTRPLWAKKSTPIYVAKGLSGNFYYCSKSGIFNNQVKSDSSVWEHSDFYEASQTPKETKMTETPQQDLLTQALMPMITGLIDTTMKEVDVEGTIKAEVAKVVMDIPTKKLEIVDVKGITKKVDLAHRQLGTLLKAVGMGHNRPIMLTGEAGSFKTHSAELVADLLDLDFYSMSVGEQSTKSDILGFIDANGNYRSTSFRKAFEHGGLYLLDEVDAGNPNVLLSINTAISNGFVDFPDAQVKVNKKFRLIATANTFGNGANAQYVGRNKLDLATANRFFKIDWLTDWDIVEVLTNNEPWYTVFMEVKKLTDDALDGVLMGSRNCMYGADALAVGIEFDEVFKSVITNGLSEDDTELLNKAKRLWVAPSDGSKPTPKRKTKAVTKADEPAVEVEDEFSF